MGDGRGRQRAVEESWDGESQPGLRRTMGIVRGHRGRHG